LKSTKLKKISALLSLLAFGWALPLGAGEVSEYQVKAAYLFNFAKFVQWPQEVFANADTPLVIGVLGDDPFGEDLDKAVEGKTINGHIIKIRRFDNFDPNMAPDIRKCQILFIAYSEKNRLEDVIKNLRGSSILTVSEIEKFPLMGGMILFDQNGKKINLVVNPAAARKAKLEISARLLQVSKIYRSE